MKGEREIEIYKKDSMKRRQIEKTERRRQRERDRVREK